MKNIQPKYDEIYFCYQHSQPLYDVLQQETENLEYVQGVKFEFIDSLKNNGTKYFYFLTIHVKRFAIQKRLLILRKMEDIVDLALFTLWTTCFIKANLGERLSSKIRALFSSNLPAIWCKPVRSVHSWVLDQS